MALSGLIRSAKTGSSVIAHILQRAFADVEIEHGEEFAVRSGIGDQGLAAGIGDHDGLRHGVVGMAAENNVDAGDSGWRA